MSKTCLIISGGEFDPLPIDSTYDCVIACDLGYAHALRLGISPDIIMGDFDSYNGDLPSDKEIIRLPVQKDDTDTCYAAKYALERGYDDITVICAMGGRFDHEYSNIQTLCHIARQGCRATMSGSDTVIHAICAGSVTIPRRDGWSFSVFAVSNECSGITISRAEYNVSDITLYNTFPRGTSNNWAEDTAFVSCRSGILLVIEAKN